MMAESMSKVTKPGMGVEQVWGREAFSLAIKVLSNGKKNRNFEIVFS